VSLLRLQVLILPMKVISTFSGAGGSSLGLKQAGFTIPVALEFIASAAEAYRANSTGTEVLGEDIRSVDPSRLLRMAGADVGELDVLEGSPPCDTFSTAGKRAKGWGIEKNYYEGKRQRVDDLVFVFLALAEALKPRAVLMENVEGLTIGSARKYLFSAIRELQALGYQRVDARVYDGADYGLPQRRRRLVLVALRDDVEGDFVPPEATHPKGKQVSVGMALDGLEATLDPLELAKPFPESTDKIRELWHRTPQGQDLGKAHLKVFGRAGMFSFKKGHPNQVSWTVPRTMTTCHWGEPRLYHIPELRRIGGFPDEFILPGGFSQKWGRIGMSVAPPMYRAIGARLGDALAEGSP